MNTNMTGLYGFQNSSHPCALDESSLSFGGVNILEMVNKLLYIYIYYSLLAVNQVYKSEHISTFLSTFS